MTTEALPRDLAGLRVLITHDWLVSWGGSERCVEQMLQLFPDADLMVGVHDPRMAERNAVTERARETWLGRVPFAHTHHRWLLPLEGPAFWSSVDTSRYDVVLSSAHAFSKMVRRRAGTVHVCYCYTPPRYLYDLYPTYRRDARGVQKAALIAGAGVLRWLDQRSVAQVDAFVAISQYIADRITRAYQRPSTVVYPPVATKGSGHAASVTRGDFLLHLGRLVPYKRVDLAIEAANALGLRFVIAGDGPERAHLERLAGPTVEFLGAVSEHRAGELLSSCRAFYFGADEDFGIAPVEANAHGAPVVGYGYGGLLETMVAGRTAEFFEQQNATSVADAVTRTWSRSWHPDPIRTNAARFAPEHFRHGLLDAVRAAIRAM